MSQSQRLPTDAELRRRDVVDEAKSWLRTPYHHRAHLRGVGVDCAWLLIEVYSAVGLIEWFDPGDYPMDWMMHRDEERYLHWVEKHGRRVEAPQPGDIAVWQFGRTFSHGAIVVDWPTVIHAYRQDGMVSYGDATQGKLADREILFYTLFED